MAVSPYASPFGVQTRNRLGALLGVSQTGSLYRKPPATQQVRSAQAAPIPGAPAGVTPAAPVAPAVNTNPVAQIPSLISAPGYRPPNPLVAPNLQKIIQAGGSNPGAPSSGGPPNLDLGAIYSNALQSDPAYQAALQAAKAQRQLSASGFLTQLKQSLIGYGSLDYAHKVLDPLKQTLGKYTKVDLGDQFWNSISQNPETSFSTLGQLNRQTPRLLHQTTDQVNKANLFYGGHGAQAIADQTYANQKAYSDADRAVQATIAGDRQVFQTSLAQIDFALSQAAEAAYMRALQQAYAYGIGGGYGGGGGSGGSSSWNIYGGGNLPPWWH